MIVIKANNSLTYTSLKAIILWCSDRVAMLDYGEFVPEALNTSLDPDYRTISGKLEVLPDPGALLALLKQGTHALLEINVYIKIVFPVDFHVCNTLSPVGSTYL